MFLQQLRRRAEEETKTKGVSGVIAVPAYFTECQRRAILQACEIAEIQVLRLMNHTTAAALIYGIYKEDLPKEGINVAFADIGHSDTTISIVNFSTGKLKVIATACDENLGGRDFQKVIYDKFMNICKEKYKLDLSDNIKAKTRLYQEAEKN